MNNHEYVKAVKTLREQMRWFWGTLKTPEARAQFLEDMAGRSGVTPNEVLDWMESDRIYTINDLNKKQAQAKRPQ